MEASNTSPVLHIDRSKKFDLGDSPLFESVAAHYTVGKENPRSLILRDVDPKRITLKMIFDEMENLKDIQPAHYNEYIQKNLDQLEHDGYFLLDAKVLQALLEEPELIPIEWQTITDADSMPTDTSGSIGFYGTYLQSKDNDTTQEILTPFFNKGHWVSGGHNALFFSKEDLVRFEQHPVLNVRKYAAVYLS